MPSHKPRRASQMVMTSQRPSSGQNGIRRGQSLIVLVSIQFFNLRPKSPSLCCMGLSLKSLVMALISSPCFSTNLAIHSSSLLLCCRGLLFRTRIAASSSACASSSATTLPGLLLVAALSWSSDKSSKGSFSGFNFLLRVAASSLPPSERMTLRMRPV